MVSPYDTVLHGAYIYWHGCRGGHAGKRESARISFNLLRISLDSVHRHIEIALQAIIRTGVNRQEMQNTGTDRKAYSIH
ncbi:MAG TPA: hypothetical protein VHN82_06135, partial [Methanoregula sp.]|nr:hypothetical protein [Methanoregula sp.]